MGTRGADGTPARATATFLFTDIEGHSELWESAPDAMAVALSEHERLIAEAVASSGGEIAKYEGDAVMAVFRSPDDAVAAAAIAQRALAAATWPEIGSLRVRMGLHTGTAYAREGDYFGPAVIRAARLCDAAHGRQVLASAAVVVLTPARQWVDLGDFSLRGLGGTERIHQLAAAGLADSFPPLRVVGSDVDRLPRPRTSFVGRDREVAAIHDALAGHAIVTLTGIGGSGKTRLAIEAVRAALSGYAGGADFVDLSVITDDAAVPPALASALGLESGDDPASVMSRIRSYLARRESVVVIDNCEHLLDVAAAVVDDLASACPSLRLVATSREPLRVEGEHVIHLGPLDVSSEAVELFRARVVAPGGDVESIERVCERLDGIPLAIELAAARTSHLSIAEIADRLDDRFRLLTGGRRRVQRQQTLLAALDWSHDLLTPEERALLRRLAVFAGPFELEAVEAICGGSSSGTIDHLGSLVERSMVDHIPTTGRYRLLETVRLYAEQKLFDASETEEYRRRHRDRFLAVLAALPLDETFFICDTSRGLVPDIADLRAAVRWSIDAGEMETAADLFSRLPGVCGLLNANEAGIWATEVVPHLELGSELWFRAFVAGMWSASYGTGRVGEVSGGADVWPAEFIELLRELGRRAEQRSDGISVLARAIVGIALLAFGRRVYDDRALEAEGDHYLASGVAAADRDGSGSAWNCVAYGQAAMQAGLVEEPEDAAQLLRRAVASCDADYMRDYLEPVLAFVLHLLDDGDCMALAAQVRARATALDFGVLLAAVTLALALAAQGDDSAARHELRACVSEIHRFSLVWRSTVLIAAAGVALSGGADQLAGRWVAASDPGDGIFTTAEGYVLYRRYLRALEERLTPEQWEEQLASGRALGLDPALEEVAAWVST